MIYLGIDNGVTGSIAAVDKDGVPLMFEKMPIKNVQNYQKTEVKFINRIDVVSTIDLIIGCMKNNNEENVAAVIERPMVNPKMFNSTMSGIRAWEAIMVVFDLMIPKKISYSIVDSKNWQRYYFGKSFIGADQKRVSMERGIAKFPSFEDSIRKHKDADSLFMADFCRLYIQQGNELIKL